jgi:hypothetical protein
MIDAYLDESGIHDGAAICVIAGYFGGRGQFGKLDQAWKRVLEDFNFPVADLHATDLIKSHRHAPMLKVLAETIARQSKIHPVSFGIVVEDFQSFPLKQRQFMTGATLKNGKLVTSGSPNKPYFVPFQFCIKKVAQYAPVGGKADFFFGLDRPFAKYATSLFDEIKKNAPFWNWESKDRLGGREFPLASETAGLQAADLLAHLTYKHMLERYAANDWDVQPTGILLDCLTNSRAIDDHEFQDKHCLQATLEKSYQLVGNWDGSGLSA